MTRDLLDEAVEALRASVQQPHDAGAASWQAIETGSSSGGVAAGAAWKLPFALATTGTLIAGFVAWLALSPAAKPVESTAATSTPAAARATPRPFEVPSAQVSETRVSPSAELSIDATPIERARRKPRRVRPHAPGPAKTRTPSGREGAAASHDEPSSAAREKPVAAPRLDPAQSTQRFREIHLMQFSAPATQVLEAWDQFLRDRPTPELAIEARYHRGVLLQRLGRLEEAREALLPFARGRHGPRRQASAQRLLGE